MPALVRAAACKHLEARKTTLPEAEQPILRFAPSPTGNLHLGHALSALINQRLARQLGGHMLVRIEDTDRSRVRQEFIEGILRDLKWLGVTWQEPVIHQSEYFDVYCQFGRRLKDLGLIYPCFATRAEIAMAVSDGSGATDPSGAPIYPGLYRDADPSNVRDRLANSDPHALRLNMAKALQLASDRSAGAGIAYTAFDADGSRRSVTCHPQRWGDVVIIRKDGWPSYHLASVVDDARNGITHIVRGQDLESATDIHRLLQVILDLPEPQYHHHELVLDKSGRKLSKSERDVSLKWLRESGGTVDEVHKELARFLAKYTSNAGSK